MRVIAGTAKSAPLRYPKGADIRPTTDAMREAMFASLAERVIDARFADLYAGSGAVGIEALSRGADTALFVEMRAQCVRTLEQNLEATRLQDDAVVVRGAVERVWRAAAETHGPFDIVFVDPPYGHRGLGGVARRLIVEGEGVAADGLVVLQCAADTEALDLPPPTRTRRFGHTELRHYDRGA